MRDRTLRMYSYAVIFKSGVVIEHATELLSVITQPIIQFDDLVEQARGHVNRFIRVPPRGAIVDFVIPDCTRWLP